MRSVIAILALTLAAPALAQQAPPQRPPMEQALSERLGVEIGACLNATATVIDLQRQLAAAQARVKALEEKYEQGAPKP